MDRSTAQTATLAEREMALKEQDASSHPITAWLDGRILAHKDKLTPALPITTWLDSRIQAHKNKLAPPRLDIQAQEHATFFPPEEDSFTVQLNDTIRAYNDLAAKAQAQFQPEIWHTTQKHGLNMLCSAFEPPTPFRETSRDLKPLDWTTATTPADVPQGLDKIMSRFITKYEAGQGDWMCASMMTPADAPQALEKGTSSPITKDSAGKGEEMTLPEGIADMMAMMESFADELGEIEGVEIDQ